MDDSTDTRLRAIEENQKYIIELLHEIIETSPNISPNLVSVLNGGTGEPWTPPRESGLSNSAPINRRPS